ncbi:MAG TPA: hypothetical protein VFA77_06545, partial [Candidatus Eisenbacteria bacterium]|nr:hypothetical protein [Candidatus Eisenbacteria bacterium]
MISMFARRIFVAVSLVMLSSTGAFADDPTLEELLAKAEAAFAKGNKVEAIALSTKATESAPKSFKGYH